MERISRRKAAFALASTAVAGVALSTRQAHAEPHPHYPKLFHALQALEDAENELRDERRDFHGEKEKAIEAIQVAKKRIRECADMYRD